jgi:quercetin dioxygenase-like cupin family protein
VVETVAEFGEWQTAGDGIRRKIFKPGQQLMSMLIEFKAGAKGAEHAHFHEQIGFVISGSFAMMIDGVPCKFSSGEQIYVPSNARHSIQALEDSLLLEVFTPLRDDLLKSLTEE